MTAILHVDGDEKGWVVHNDVETTLAATLEAAMAAGDVVAVPVVSPYLGTLLVNCRAVGTATLLVPGGLGVLPSHLAVAAASLVLGGSQGRVYQLAGATGDAAVAQVKAAMQAGTTVQVEVHQRSGKGPLWLNGRKLGCACVAPPSPAG